MRICGVTIKDRIRNEEIRKRLGLLSDLSSRVDRWLLKWFGRVERLDGERMVKGWRKRYMIGGKVKQRETKQGFDRWSESGFA